MYQIAFLGIPDIRGFKPSPINGKISGGNLTARIVITKDGTIFSPQDPVSICAWLQTTTRLQPRYLSPTSGKKDDTLWTRTAAEEGFLAIVFRITTRSLDMSEFPKMSLKEARLMIRADLPRSTLTNSFSTNISIAPNESVVDLHSTELSRPEGEGGKSSVLQALLDRASTQTPLDVIALGVAKLSLATQLACRLSMKMREGTSAQRVPGRLFEPSTIVVADDAAEILTIQGKDRRTDEWAQGCIKAEYIDLMILGPVPLSHAVRLRFQHLDSMGLGDGACDRAWSLIIASDNSSLSDGTREATAKQIEALTFSSIWHSPERASPKLLLQMSGEFSGDEVSLLEMIRSDGWEAVEVLDRLPEELALEDPEHSEENIRSVLLEHRRDAFKYVEVVLASERKSSTNVEQNRVAHTQSNRLTDDTTDCEMTGHVRMHGQLDDSQVMQPAGQRPRLQTAHCQTFPYVESQEAGGRQNQVREEVYEALYSC